MDSIAIVKPTLRYKNPDPRGVHLIKFDDAYAPAGAPYQMLVERRTKLALWTPQARAVTIRQFERVMCALRQNPGYKMLCELSTAEAVEQARFFVRGNGFSSDILIGRADDV